MNRNPFPTVDIIIEVGERIVLIERKNPPHGWALPGGFVDYGESVETAAAREALEETSLEVRDLRQFRVYSDPARDPRRHTITTVFIARAEGTPRAADDAADARLVDPAAIAEPLAFDHGRIIADYLAHKGISAPAAAAGEQTDQPERNLEEKETSMLGQLLQDGSGYRKYRRIQCGEKGFFYFLKFEIITFLFSSLGGALGLFLRKVFFRRLLKKCGRGVVFGRHVTLRQPHKIEIGDNVFIDDFAVLDAKGQANGGIRIGSNCFIGRNSVLSCKEGDIDLADYVSISNNCSLLSETRLQIGRCSYISGHCYLVAGGNHKYDRRDIPIMFQESESKGGIVLAGDNWLGAGVRVLDGGNLGQGTVIGAGSVVYKPVEPYVIAVGVPAMVVKRRK